MTDKSSKPRGKAERERAAKMRAAYTNPYRTTTAAQRRIAQDRVEERELAKSEEERERLRDQRRSRAENAEISHTMVEQLLHNPTKFVSEAELRAEYTHVAVDIRNMAILAAALIVVLVLLAFTLPQ